MKPFKNNLHTWLLEATPNSHEIKLQYFYIYNGTIFPVDGKHVHFEKGKKFDEIMEVANLLKKTLGGSIYLLPKVEIPEKVQTADLLFRGVKYDLKTLTGFSETILNTNIRNREKQAHNFLINITKSKVISEFEKEMYVIYKKDNMQWLENLFFIKDDAIIGIFERT